MEIEWNPGWEEEIKKAVEPALREFVRKNQPKMDALTDRLRGHSIQEIKPVVQREMSSWGGSLSDDAELTRVATAISRGERVLLHLEPIN